MDACPCGSDRAYADCCEPCILGARPAATAEQLMRSRYTAYVKHEIPYLVATSHPDHRDDQDEAGIREWSEGSEWHGLEILGVEQGGPDDDEGAVEFAAEYSHDGDRTRHHERATFAKRDGAWYLVKGERVKLKPFVREEAKTGRNDPCPCGSGKKFKKCCGVAG
jgi:SEC-C motif-containing protein